MTSRPSPFFIEGLPDNSAAVKRDEEVRALEATYPYDRCPSFRSAASLRRNP